MIIPIRRRFGRQDTVDGCRRSRRHARIAARDRVDGFSRTGFMLTTRHAHEVIAQLPSHKDLRTQDPGEGQKQNSN